MENDGEYATTLDVRIIRDWLYSVRCLEGCPEFNDMLARLDKIEMTIVAGNALRTCIGGE